MYHDPLTGLVWETVTSRDLIHDEKRMQKARAEVSDKVDFITIAFNVLFLSIYGENKT